MQYSNWNDIRVFLTVAQAGTLKLAAKKLNTDPTTLGRRIRRLEKGLECTLFERTKSGHHLTTAGEKLLIEAETMANAAHAIDARMAESAGLVGSLRISVSEGFGSQFLTRYVSGFCEKHPDLQMELVASNGFLSPSRREADIAVMLSRPKVGPITAQKLSDYTLQLYASPKYLRKRAPPQTPQELTQDHTLIGYVADLLYAPELNYLDEVAPDLSAHISSSSLLAQADMVANGVGIAVLPNFIAIDNPEFQNILPQVKLTRTFWLVAHLDTQGIRRIKVGKEWLLDCVRQGRNRLILGD